jgi:hypothetical protein
MFADGESREFITEQVATQQAHAHTAASGLARQGGQGAKVNGMYVRDRAKLNASWGTVSAPGEIQDNGPAPDSGDERVTPSRPPLPSSFIGGRPASEIAAEEAAENAAGGNGNAATASRNRRLRKPAPPSPEDLAQARELSRERSGSSSSEDD